jgi:hypothetical protein
MTGAFREELKFIIRPEIRRSLLQRWSRHLIKDPHTNVDAVTPVLSQYFDSPSMCFFEEKLDGVGFRNKVRLRTYDYRFKDGALAFLEIKQKLGNRVRKIRQRLELESSWLDPPRWSLPDDPAWDAFHVLRERHRLRSTAQVFYLREAYQSTVEPDVRVTFDTVLRALEPGARLSREALLDGLGSIIPEHLVILEVKHTTGLPHWVTAGALAAGLDQQPVPKYVMAVSRLGLQHNILGGVYA